MFENVPTKTDDFLVKHELMTGKDNALEWTEKTIKQLPKEKAKAAK